MSSYTDWETEDVAQFFEKMGMWATSAPCHISPRKLAERVAFLQEELDELKAAGETNDLAKQVDALIDLVYVAKGTALLLGVEWEKHWDEVQRANLAKEPGVTSRGNKLDAVKPPGWLPPDHESLLSGQGYAKEDWVRDCKLVDSIDDGDFGEVAK